MSSSSIQIRHRHYDPESLSDDCDLHPILKRVFSARGIRSCQEVGYDVSALIPPNQITHLQQAAEFLANHIQRNNRILVFGDYDADGATSAALCIRALKLLGHHNNEFYLPDRVKDGYGVSENVAERIIQLKPDLIITVDTGIASFKGLGKIIDAQIDVIVTDHHLPADHLPPASVIVNPNAFEQSKGKNLAGVGVAFYLMLAVRSQLRETEWFKSRPEPNLADCLDLVAIGTVADLVALDYNNRTLVHEGLKRIRADACSMGITQLINLSGRNQKSLTSQDIAFALAPRINAAGRLDDMSIGVQTLLANDQSSAYELALELDNINRYRRELQGQMTEQAMALLPDLHQSSGHYSHVLYQPDWHEGIVGIIASKIKDMTFRPSISFAASANGFLKGSCRSIPGVHIRDMLDLVDKTAPDLIERFGGHALAAGLTIKSDKLERFRDVFESTLQQNISPDCFDNVIECDGELETGDLTMELARLIQDAGPWGQKFPLPSFSGRFKVLDQRLVCERHLKFVLTPEHMERPLDAILFYASDKEIKTNYQLLQIHYELGINEYQGLESLQLVIRHIVES